MNTATPAAAATPAETVSLYAAHAKIYARAVKGRFVQWRWAAVWLTQIVFYGLPWVNWNGRPAVLFELASRRFYIFDLVLYPQDFIYLTALLLLAAYSLFFFTAVAGRLWCGYACPQTVYSEIFMWIERRIEGDRPQRMKLDAAPWSVAKLARKGGKQLAWISVALWTGFTFAGYFTPIRELATATMALNLGPWQTFWVLFYGFATWGNAGFMREQVCKYMCPYARFQSAMFDRDTLIISYDTKRGEPRGARLRKSDPAAAAQGACVDCGLCVQVCPTGIDIREGPQVGCITCALCIDACDQVMDKVGRPRGLIDYATLIDAEKEQKGEPPTPVLRTLLRPRTLLYFGAWSTIGIAMLFMLGARDRLDITVQHDANLGAVQMSDGTVRNSYEVKLRNMQSRPRTMEIGATGLAGARIWNRDGNRRDAAPTLKVAVPADSVAKLTLFVAVPATGPDNSDFALTVRALDDEGGADSARTRFERR